MASLCTHIRYCHRRHRKGCSLRNCPVTCTRGEWLPRARLVPHFLFIFQLGFPTPPAQPPLAPLSIDAIVPHFLQLLHFLFSFVSSFPRFKKWKTLSFRNKETSGLGLEGQFFRTWQIPVRLAPPETQSSAQLIKLSCQKSFFASIWVRNKLMNFCLVANWRCLSKRLFYTAESAARSVRELRHGCIMNGAVHEQFLSQTRFLSLITAGTAITYCRFRHVTWRHKINCDSIETRLRAGRSGGWIPTGTRDFIFFSKTCTPSLGPTQLPI